MLRFEHANPSEIREGIIYQSSGDSAFGTTSLERIKECWISFHLLFDNIKPTHELTVCVELWERGPVREFFETLADVVIGEDVEEACRSVLVWARGQIRPWTLR